MDQWAINSSVSQARRAFLRGCGARGMGETADGGAKAANGARTRLGGRPALGIVAVVSVIVAVAVAVPVTWALVNDAAAPCAAPPVSHMVSLDVLSNCSSLQNGALAAYGSTEDFAALSQFVSDSWVLGSDGKPTTDLGYMFVTDHQFGPHNATVLVHPFVPTGYIMPYDSLEEQKQAAFAPFNSTAGAIVDFSLHFSTRSSERSDGIVYQEDHTKVIRYMILPTSTPGFIYTVGCGIMEYTE